MSEARLRIATWNVHRCVGTDGRCDPARIARVLRSFDCDVIALQEVDDREGPHEHSMQLGYLARAAGMTPIEGQTIARHDGHYGNAILTRLRVQAVRRHDLSVPRREPRGALDVELVIDDTRRLRIVAVHLGLTQRERLQQVGRLGASLDAAPASPMSRDESFVLCGDFNEWRRDGAVLRGLQALVRCDDEVRSPTFHSRWPLFALDRIWARRPAVLQNVRAHRAGEARTASDHLPLSATLIVAAEPSVNPSDRRPCRAPSACG